MLCARCRMRVGNIPGPWRASLRHQRPRWSSRPANSGVPLLVLPQASDAAVTPDAPSAGEDAANASAAAALDSSDRLASLEGAGYLPKVGGLHRPEAITKREQSGLLDAYADSGAALVQALATFASRTEQSSRAARQGSRDARDGQSASLVDVDLIPGRPSKATGSNLTHAEPGGTK